MKNMLSKLLLQSIDQGILKTWVGFDECDAEYPRLNLIPFPPKGMTLEKPEASMLSQASQVSSSPVKSACNPYKCNKDIVMHQTLSSIRIRSLLGKFIHTGVEPCKSTREAKSPEG